MGPDPDRVLAIWQATGWDADVAAEWVDAGWPTTPTSPMWPGDPATTPWWRRLEAAHAAAWRDAGWGPRDAMLWRWVAVPAEASAYRALGLTPDTAKTIISALRIESGQDRPCAGSVADWVATGLPATRIALLIRAGITLAEATTPEVLATSDEDLTALAALRVHAPDS